MYRYASNNDFETLYHKNMPTNESFRRAMDLFDEGEFSLAADLARQVLSIDPEDGPMWQLFGAALWRLKDLPAAQDALEEAGVRVPLGALGQFALAECYMASGHVESAGAIYQHLGATALHVGVLSSVAKRLGELTQFGSALQACERIIELDPTSHQAYFGKAYYLARLGQPPETLVAPLATAMDLAPHVWTYRVNLAFTWSEMGRVEQAHALLKPVPLEAIRCPCMLRRMRGIFDRAGDAGRSFLCKMRLSCLLQ
jgi:Flp pilus assembly protein TadD